MTTSALVLASLLTAGGHDVPPLQDPPQDPPPEYPAWKGALALGATWTDGNTETETLTGTFNAERRDEDDRWTFDGYANYGKNTDLDVDPEEEHTTTNNSGAGVKYDYFYTQKLYFYGNTSAKVDHVADLDLRAIFGVGAGYQWKETEKLKWGTDLGLSYIDEDYAGTESDESFLAARVASNLAYQISESAAFEQVAEVMPSLEDNEDTLAKIDNRLKLVVTGSWIAQIQYVLDFDGSVPAGKEETDHRIVVGVGWTFGS